MNLLGLVVEDESTILNYKKLFTSKNYILSNEIILSDEKYSLNDELIVIDIKSSRGFELLDNISFKDKSYVVVISPISQRFIKIPQTLKNTNLFFITKPIDIVKFEIILKDSLAQIRKSEYLKSKEKILVKSVDESPLETAIYDFDGALLYANKPYINTFKIDDVNNTSFDKLGFDIDFKDIAYNLKVKGLYTFDKRVSKRWYKSHFYISDDRSIVEISIDQTDTKTYIESLKKSSQFFEQSNEGAIITDKNGFIISTNTSFCNITGYTKDEAIGKPTSLLNSGIHDKSFYENMWDSLTHYSKWQGEIWNKRKNGEVYPEWLSITKFSDPITKEINYMAIFTDITSLKEADKKLHFYANHDHLTGLLNKVQFENILKQTINSAVRNNRKFALMFIDLDYFKDVNDTAGHNVGDLVLKEVASRLLKTLRKEDVIARIGGDEFNVIIDNVTQDSDVILLADKLNESIRKPFLFDGKKFYLSLSIGVSIFPYHGLNPSELSKNADSAMYEVKANGRNGVLLYNKKFTDSLIKKVSLHSDLKKAIKDEEFEVYYQPVVDIKLQKVVGAEALIRWNHREKGFISPEEFIHIAEHHGLINEIGSFVIRKVCEDLPRFLNKFGEDFILAFNVSSKEFADEEYLPKLLEFVNDFHLSPKNLELEITETYIMQNHTLAIDKMKELRSNGFNIAIDDFGTGYSSLSYLKKFPINKIKVDKSFVLDIINDQDDNDMVKAIINIAKIFNLEVQAEGVETLEHLQILKELSADIAQGYYYSKPVNIDDVLSKKWSLEQWK